jgi:hypothetical protein
LGITSRGLVDTKLLRFNLGKQNGWKVLYL